MSSAQSEVAAGTAAVTFHLASVGGLIAAGFLLAISIGDRPVEPPVHLKIQVVTDTEAPVVETEQATDGPPAEFDRP